jgi:nucleoside-diphosphate-sugar epimerase
MINNKTILVTGGAGFIGFHLSERLLLAWIISMTIYCFAEILMFERK